jgi:hypothetical protein
VAESGTINRRQAGPAGLASRGPVTAGRGRSSVTARQPNTSKSSDRAKGAGVAAQRNAGATIDANGYRPRHSDPLHDAVNVSVVVDGVVLGRAVVPHRHVAFVPAPTYGVLGVGTRCWSMAITARDSGPERLNTR